MAIQRQQLELKKKQEAQKRALTEVSLLAVLVEKEKYCRAEGYEARGPDAPVFCTSKASKVSTCTMYYALSASYA